MADFEGFFGSYLSPVTNISSRQQPILTGFVCGWLLQWKKINYRNWFPKNESHTKMTFIAKV